VSIGAKIRYDSEENSSGIVGLKCRKAMMEMYEIVKNMHDFERNWVCACFELFVFSWIGLQRSPTFCAPRAWANSLHKMMSNDE
jgi:hypothetical protein